MRKLERLLESCISGGETSNTIRTLIGFKHRSQYQKVMKELSKQGITPVKCMRESNAICCHVHPKHRNRLHALNAHPQVEYVEPDYKMKAHGLPQSRLPARRIKNSKDQNTRCKLPAVTWNICRIKAPRVWPRTRGNETGIGIIDTGIAKHPDLRIAGGINTINGGSFLDDNGHGTHVAGIAAALGTNGQIPGAAPRARLYAIKALDANGEGYISDIIEGIEWCSKKKIPIINMSFGLEGGSSRALRDAVRRAYRKGTVIVASAGNNGRSSGRIDEPGRYPEVIAVAASTRRNKIASFSSRGKGIAITAPGSNIKSTWLNGGYKILSGTSMSCPHAAGTAALLLSLRPRLTPAAVKRRLESTARPLPGFSQLSQGSGLLNAAKAAETRNQQGKRRLAPHPNSSSPPLLLAGGLAPIHQQKR
ncbi:S8 family peptidase [Paenibacillus nasutitermitis]|uniref:Aerolysin n=1 Tax=Paenibacillus nasutitermitis TaxID=1652958 RepID=A0A916Z0A7_9BACL|nr:S8 family peptidase [Paenibacillus nasutitermitis]GGD69858.1 aerolysin [Paenibacillus nasutitermitis]